MAEKAIDELHRLADDLGGHSLWSVLDIGSAEKWGAEPCGEKLHDRLRSIAERIEREHAEELETKDAEIEQLREDLAERHELTAEAALRELGDELCDGGKWAYGRFEIANRIRNAIVGAPKPDTDREAAVDWVDEQGGIDVVRDYPKMDGFVATLANDLGVSDDVECGDDLREAVKGVINKYRETLVKIGCMLGYEDGELPVLPEMLPEMLLGELDKRLLPQGMEWPRFEDGERVNIGDEFAWAGTTYTCDAVKFGDGFALNSDDAPSSWYGYSSSDHVKRPEVLGADKLPIKVGDTVNNDYTSHAVAEVHASGAPYGGDCPWVRYTDGEWDFANSVTHGVIDTQERIDEDAQRNPVPYVRDVLKRDNWDKLTEHQALRLMIPDIMRRQRELDARTMGGAR